MSTDIEPDSERYAGPWGAVQREVDEFVDSYELLGENEAGEDCCYTPTEQECYMIKDAIAGLLADEAFITAFVRAGGGAGVPEWRLVEPKKEGD